MSEEQLSKLSEEVYSTPQERRRELENYVLDPRYNYDTLAVYHHKTNGSSVFAHRGTKLTGSLYTAAKDLWHDKNIVADNFDTSVRYKRHLETARKIAESMPDRNWQHTGHSLGGLTAMQVGRALNQDQRVFNPGISPLANTLHATTAKTHIHYNKNDWIANTAPKLLNQDKSIVLHEKMHHYGGIKNSHNLAQFYSGGT
jgi:hypothetical protein